MSPELRQTVQVSPERPRMFLSHKFTLSVHTTTNPHDDNSRPQPLLLNNTISPYGQKKLSLIHQFFSLLCPPS